MPIINVTDILKNSFKLSPNNYANIEINSINMKELNSFVDNIDKGIEIGTQNYVSISKYHFLRTSAFSEQLFSLKVDNNSFINMNPNVFIDKSLSKGDILICKDSNVGEVVLLDDDIENTMFSAGINRIKFKKNYKYFFAVMKNDKFKKQLDTLIPKGATLKHAKDLYLKCKVPIITNKNEIKHIENIVDIIMHKENLINKQKEIIDNYIYEEINNNQKKLEYTYQFPTAKEIILNNRLDTGTYTDEFKEIDFKIKNYKYGFYMIDPKKIKGGNTPKKRYIKEDLTLKYLWITPTYINDNGTILNNTSIECEKNNINENCALIINRTSKGGEGEFVGISSYYDYNMNGKAQHNQGIYKVFNYDDNELIYITCMMNSEYYRKYCANLSMGSKMKELKLNNILQIPFPKFELDKKIYIKNLYYNKEEKREILNEKEFLIKNYEWDNKAGLLDLYCSVKNAKKELNKIVNNLYEGKKIEIEYKIY